MEKSLKTSKFVIGLVTGSINSIVNGVYVFFLLLLLVNRTVKEQRPFVYPCHMRLAKHLQQPPPTMLLNILLLTVKNHQSIKYTINKQSFNQFIVVLLFYNCIRRVCCIKYTNFFLIFGKYELCKVTHIFLAKNYDCLLY